jgi:hypothetical protein
MSRLLLLLAGVLLAACDSAPDQSGALGVRYLVEGAPAAISFIGAEGPAETESTGAWEHRFEAPPGTLLSLQATSSSGAPLTASIFLNDVPFRVGRGLSVALDASTSGYQSGEVELHGFIEALATDRVTVLSLGFLIDERTELLGRDNEAVPLSAFRVGDYVEVEGRARGDGLFSAEKLKLEDGTADDEVELHGIVEARTESSLTVQGVLFEVDERTELLDDDNRPVTFDAFQVGERVEVEGFARPDDTHYAEKVKLDDD